MNMRHGLFYAAQFDYYKSVLRKRKRFSKWPKAEKNTDLDVIQEVYQCNRTVAKQYLNVLNKEQLVTIHDKVTEGG
jgi:archaellum component FlaF (FlaF/FlaG flagellin family)